MMFGQRRVAISDAGMSDRGMHVPTHLIGHDLLAVPLEV
jgi:hypothetical protein